MLSTNQGVLTVTQTMGQCCGIHPETTNLFVTLISEPLKGYVIKFVSVYVLSNLSHYLIEIIMIVGKVKIKQIINFGPFLSRPNM